MHRLFRENKRLRGCDSVEQNGPDGEKEKRPMARQENPKTLSAFCLFNKQIGWHEHRFGIGVDPNLQYIQHKSYEYIADLDLPQCQTGVRASQFAY